jgi:hypothetical protein
MRKLNSFYCETSWQQVGYRLNVCVGQQMEHILFLNMTGKMFLSCSLKGRALKYVAITCLTMSFGNRPHNF